MQQPHQPARIPNRLPEPHDALGLAATPILVEQRVLSQPVALVHGADGEDVGPAAGLVFFHGMSGNLPSIFTGSSLGLASSSSGSPAAEPASGGFGFSFQEAMRACKP